MENEALNLTLKLLHDFALTTPNIRHMAQAANAILALTEKEKKTPGSFGKAKTQTSPPTEKQLVLLRRLGAKSKPDTMQAASEMIQIALGKQI